MDFYSATFKKQVVKDVSVSEDSEGNWEDSGELASTAIVLANSLNEAIFKVKRLLSDTISSPFRAVLTSDVQLCYGFTFEGVSDVKPETILY